MSTNTEKASKAAGWVTGLLTGWGVPGSIARILAGAVIGAIAAIVATTASGCTADFKQTAEGLEYHHSLLPIDTTNTK